MKEVIRPVKVQERVTISYLVDKYTLVRVKADTKFKEMLRDVGAHMCVFGAEGGISSLRVVDRVVSRLEEESDIKKAYKNNSTHLCLLEFSATPEKEKALRAILDFSEPFCEEKPCLLESLSLCDPGDEQPRW